jgi:hypothetical protein
MSPGPAAEPPPQAPGERPPPLSRCPGPRPGTRPGDPARDRVTGDPAGARACHSEAASMARTTVYKVTNGPQPGVREGRPPDRNALVAAAEAADRHHHRRHPGADVPSPPGQGKRPDELPVRVRRRVTSPDGQLRNSPSVSRKMGLTIPSRVPKPRDHTAVFRTGAGRRKKPGCCSGCHAYRRREHVGHRMEHGCASGAMAPER